MTSLRTGPAGNAQTFELERHLAPAGSAGAFLLFGWAALVPAAEPLNDTYRETADKLMDAALADKGGYEKLSYLCDRIGNRLSGSPGLERAIQWAAEQMKKDGLVNVATPAVKVPHWVRGRESASLLTPVRKPLHMLGLGGSIATPQEGITAEVIPVVKCDDRVIGAGKPGPITRMLRGRFHELTRQ